MGDPIIERATYNFTVKVYPNGQLSPLYTSHKTLLNQLLTTNDSD
jgi:hypothetical protein